MGLPRAIVAASFASSRSDSVDGSRRTDNGNWTVPGGAVDLGESVAQAAGRETLEESGIRCDITGTGGRNLLRPLVRDLLYQQRREVRQEFSHRPATERTANTKQRVKRGPLGPGVRALRLHDGPVDAHPHQRLPVTQRITGDHLIPRARVKTGLHRRPVKGSNTYPSRWRPEVRE